MTERSRNTVPVVITQQVLADMFMDRPYLRDMILAEDCLGACTDVCNKSQKPTEADRLLYHYTKALFPNHFDANGKKGRSYSYLPGKIEINDVCRYGPW